MENRAERVRDSIKGPPNRKVTHHEAGKLFFVGYPWILHHFLNSLSNLEQLVLHFVGEPILDGPVARWIMFEVGASKQTTLWLRSGYNFYVR